MVMIYRRTLLPNRNGATRSRQLQVFCTESKLRHLPPCEGRTMQPSSLGCLAPSSTLLKFLRAQSEKLCFFTPNAERRTARWVAPARSAVQSAKRLRDAALPDWLAATPQRHDPAQASLLNLDTLWSPSKRNGFPPPFISSAPSGLHSPTSMPGMKSRYASTCNESWLRRLWGSKSQRGQTALRPDDLPPLTSFLDEGAETSMFNISRSMMGKASNELKLRCTEFDENGNVVLVDGELKKSELIAKVFAARPISVLLLCVTHFASVLVRPAS